MGFLTALEFLTRLRVRRAPPGNLQALAAAQGWFPAVGLALGGLLVALDRVTSRALPQPSVDVLLVVALAAMTGALHLDGLADTADGIWGGHDAERRLAIMRDVRIGAFGVVAIVSVLALKWAGLGALPSDVRVEALVLTPCLARFALLVAAPAFPAARPDGLGAAFRGAARPSRALFGGAVTAAAAIALLGVGGMYAIACSAACALAIGAYATRRIGGVTGDVYGATVEVTETTVLLFIAALANRGWISAWLLA